MAFARSIRVIVIFNKVDISDEIAHSISSLNYTDNSKNAIDDLEIELENLDYRWLKEWYPDENAQLLVGGFTKSWKTKLIFWIWELFMWTSRLLKIRNLL
ncbi:hypothetical protein [Leptotrichia wadei]|uniref:Uncharacterized protein n=1 Tax=Leptotrichia wadei (strain F0279) TaxID=888055 RepID=U2Q6H4_LEPWF|nr:hypothetical protein [Leptotrichia wadei]ERK51644.1 hypothetical protein HMPREF9015_01027 [Leptotrichia wadei F0279]